MLTEKINMTNNPSIAILLAIERRRCTPNMAVRNKIKEFVESRNMSVYAFREKAGIANKTAYDLVNTPTQIPSGNVITKICDAFEVQPNEILEWVPNMQHEKAVQSS